MRSRADLLLDPLVLAVLLIADPVALVTAEVEFTAAEVVPATTMSTQDSYVWSAAVPNQNHCSTY